MKAIIFAAGRGERMRPLTDTTAKSLLMLAGKPLIVHNIERCQQAGIKDIVINVSYKGDEIKQALGDGSRFGVSIQYSTEDEALETAGGIIKALPLLGDKPFIAISADIWADFDLKKLSMQPLNNALAHLLLVNNPDFHPRGDFTLIDGIVCQGAQPRFTYANAGIYHPALFQPLPEQKLSLGALLNERLSEGKVTGEVFEGHWFNLGTPEQLKHAELALKEAS